MSKNRNNQYDTQPHRWRLYQRSIEGSLYESLRHGVQGPQGTEDNQEPRSNQASQSLYDETYRYRRSMQGYRQQAARQRRRHKIIGAVIAAVAVVAIAVFAVPAITGQLGQGLVATDDSQQTDDQANASQDQQSSVSADPRSAFAVQPGNVPSNYDGDDEYVVYLTIDDGPSELTPYYLDLFDKYNVKATFFVTGYNTQCASYIKDAYDRGHTIGLHTYSHEYSEVYASDEAYFEDLNKIGQVVKEQIGYVPCFIRFPGGSSNTVSAHYSEGIMSRLVNEVQEQGYQYYDWNVSSGDGSTLSTEEIITASCDSTRHNIMLLCHDSATKQTTLDALPAIIEHYQSLGYTFKAINRNSLVSHHGVNN